MLVLHLLNRLLAALLSIAVVAATVVLVVEIARWALEAPAWLVPWRDWGTPLAELRVDDPGLRVAAGVALAVGLLLLAFELWPRRPVRYPAEPLGPGSEAAVTASGLRSTVVTAAREVAGVRSASVRARRRSVSVKVHTRARDRAPETRQTVRDGAVAALADLRLRRPPSVRVSVREDVR